MAEFSHHLLLTARPGTAPVRAYLFDRALHPRQARSWALKATTFHEGCQDVARKFAQ